MFPWIKSVKQLALYLSMFVSFPSFPQLSQLLRILMSSIVSGVGQG